MFISTEFEFDNEKSMDYQVKLIKMDSGFIKQSFGYNRNITYEKIPGKRSPIYFKEEHNILEFTIQIARLDYRDIPIEWDSKFKQKLVKWLFKSDFRDFRSMDNPSVVYKVMFIDDNSKFEIGTNHGYIELKAVSIFSSAFTPIILNAYDFDDITSPTKFEIYNPSNVVEYYYPELEFKLIGTNTGIQIRNYNDEGRLFKFEGLQAGETVYIDNENKIVESDIDFVYRLSNFNRNWFRLVHGKNKLEITGKCILKFRSQYPIAL